MREVTDTHLAPSVRTLRSLRPGACCSPLPRPGLLLEAATVHTPSSWSPSQGTQGLYAWPGGALCRTRAPWKPWGTLGLWGADSPGEEGAGVQGCRGARRGSSGARALRCQPACARPLTAAGHRFHVVSLPVYTTGSQRAAATDAAAGRHSGESPLRPCLLPGACGRPAHGTLLGGRAREERRQPR